MKRTARFRGCAAARRRKALYRPYLEFLEARLPPGDILLGALLGSWLVAPADSRALNDSADSLLDKQPDGSLLPESNQNLAAVHFSFPDDPLRTVRLEDMPTKANDVTVPDVTGRPRTDWTTLEAIAVSPARFLSPNLGVNGAESADVLAVAEKPNVKSLAASADAILLSAGGNDLSHAVTRDVSGSPVEAAARIEKARIAYAANVGKILAGLREANAKCPIALIGLYNPFGGAGPEGSLGRAVLLEWTGSAERAALAFADVRVVPTFDLFDGRPDRLAADRFHPNGKGYALIAERILQVLPDN